MSINRSALATWLYSPHVCLANYLTLMLLDGSWLRAHACSIFSRSFPYCRSSDEPGMVARNKLRVSASLTGHGRVCVCPREPFLMITWACNKLLVKTRGFPELMMDCEHEKVTCELQLFLIICSLCIREIRIFFLKLKLAVKQNVWWLHSNWYAFFHRLFGPKKYNIKLLNSWI